MLESALTDSNCAAGHGGARSGAGRRALGHSGPKEKWSTRLDPIAMMRLERLAQAYGLPKAAAVERLIQEAHRRLYDELSEEALKALGL